MISAASFSSNSPRSDGPLTLSRMPRAPSMLASSSGLEIAARAAVTARPSPDAYPTPMQRGARTREDHLHVGEVGVDEPGRRDEVGDALHTLQQHFVGHLERVQHRRALVAHLQQALVRDDDDRVDLLLQLLDAGLGLHGTAASFEAERTGHDTDRQRADAARDLGDERRATGAGAAALARGDEHHVGALEHLFDLLRGALRPPARPTSGSDPAPSPRVSWRPMSSFTSASESSSDCASVLMAMNSTPLSPASIMRLTALQPPPPTPTTLITAR